MNDTAGRGLLFPGRVAITAVGEADARLRERVPDLLEGAGARVVLDSVRQRHSRHGRYVSVTVQMECDSRRIYEKTQQVLRSEPAIRYIL